MHIPLFKEGITHRQYTQINHPFSALMHSRYSILTNYLNISTIKNFQIFLISSTPEGAWCLTTRSFNLQGVMPLGVPSVSQLGLLTSQRPQLRQGFFASLRTTSSGISEVSGQGFRPFNSHSPSFSSGRPHQNET